SGRDAAGRTRIHGRRVRGTGQGQHHEARRLALVTTSLERIARGRSARDRQAAEPRSAACRRFAFEPPGSRDVFLAYTATMPRKGKASGTPRKRRGVKLRPTDLLPRDLAVTEMPADIRELADAVDRDGGAVLATYREPLGGHVLLLCALPIDRVAPTPFQRDVSDAHVRRLTQAMDKTKRFLDPVIAVRE